MISTRLLTTGRVVTNEFIVNYLIIGAPTRGLATITVTDRMLNRTFVLVGRMSAT